MSEDKGEKTAGAKPPPLNLEKTLRLMDVADEIRRRRDRVEEHLEGTDREQIRAHLMERYREMGHDADPALLDEAIETALSQQNRFRPAAPGLGTRLATVYVRRRELARKHGLPLVAGLIVVGIAAGVAGGVSSWIQGRDARQEARAQRETESEKLRAAEREATEARRANQLAEQMDDWTSQARSRLKAIRSISRVPEATALAEQTFADLEQARLGGDAKMVQQSLSELTDLHSRLNREYTLVITKGRERDNVRYYLIVQALDANQRRVAVPVRDEETGRVETVSEWGERVDKSVYEGVGRDYADNNVVDDNVYGTKKRGYLEPERRWPSSGQITDW